MKSVFFAVPSSKRAIVERTRKGNNGETERGSAEERWRRRNGEICEKEEQPSLTNCLRLLDGDIDTLSDIVVVVVVVRGIPPVIYFQSTRHLGRR